MLEDDIKAIADRMPNVLPHLQTEQATKTALVMPFIEALGFNRLDPTEVVPEFTADIGVKTGEKVDYAIMRDGIPLMLIECKSANANLDSQHASQLLRYFSVTEAHLGILTNGVHYKFYADLDEPNRMDSKPFFELDMANLDDQLLPSLQMFTKGSFDLQVVMATASELKYTNEIKQFLGQQLQTPDPRFVRLLMDQIYSGRRTQQAIDRFTELSKTAFARFINDRVYDRLRKAINQDGSAVTESSMIQDTEERESANDSIHTSEEELEGLYIIKSILRQQVAPERITIRDHLNFCNILLDGSRRKRICRLYVQNRSQKYVGIVGDDRQEESIPIETIDGLYALSDQLQMAVRRLEEASTDGNDQDGSLGDDANGN